MLVSISVMIVSFWIPMLFPKFVHRHFYNKLRICFAAVVYFVPYIVLIQWLRQGDDALKLYFLLIPYFFFAIWYGKIIKPWAFKEPKKIIFSGSGILMIMVFSLFFWILTNLDIDGSGRYAGVLALVFTSGRQMVRHILEGSTKT
jgi:hypothetical protein